MVAYSKTVKGDFSIMRLKEHSKIAKTSKSTNDGKIKKDVMKYVHDDPNMTEVDKEFQIKGYYYGKQLVPISKVIEENLKYPTDRCLKLLGFTHSKNIPRHFFMGGVDVLTAREKNTNDRKALAALIHALFELERVAICRFVSRRNSAPKLVVLTPRF